MITKSHILSWLSVFALILLCGACSNSTTTPTVSPTTTTPSTSPQKEKEKDTSDPCWTDNTGTLHCSGAPRS
jgi:hypothetical protein